MNRVTLIGADAENKSTNNGELAILSLATKTSWKNDAGEWESLTEWHRCVAFAGMARAAAGLKKGARVLVEGELGSREYDREVAVESRRPRSASAFGKSASSRSPNPTVRRKNDTGDGPGPQ